MNRLQEKYDRLAEVCKPFLDALEHFPEIVQKFVDLVKRLFAEKAARENAERERMTPEREKTQMERQSRRNEYEDWDR